MDNFEKWGLSYIRGLDNYMLTTSDTFLNWDCASVRLSSTECVALWVVSFNVSRLTIVFKSVSEGLYKVFVFSFAEEINLWQVKTSQQHLLVTVLQKPTRIRIICQAVKNYCCHWSWRAQTDNVNWKRKLFWLLSRDRREL